jgi:hypothetical protein
MKASSFRDANVLTDIPNIGPAMVRDFGLLAIRSPQDLIGKDPQQLYEELSKIKNKRQDPCVLYTLRAVIDFMNGAPSKPWWDYMTPDEGRQI